MKFQTMWALAYIDESPHISISVNFCSISVIYFKHISVYFKPTSFETSYSISAWVSKRCGLKVYNFIQYISEDSCCL